MKDNELYLLLNFIAFAIIPYIYYRKRKTISSSLIALVGWAFSAWCGFMYVYACDYWVGQGPITVEAVLALFLLYLVFIIPLFKSSDLNNDNYIYESGKFVEYTCVFIAIIAVLPFMENFLHLFNGKTITEMGSYHDDHTNAALQDRMSFLGIKCTIFLHWFKYVTPALLFNYLNINNTNRKTWVVVGLLMAYFNSTLSSFCAGERFVVVQDGFLFGYFFLLFYNTMDNAVRHRIVQYGLIAGSLAIAGIAIISIFRFGDNQNETLLQSLYRYIGEGYNDFYTDMWYVENHTFGANIFRGMVEEVNAETLTLFTGVRMHCYYTFIGDFYCDFGLWGTLAIFIIISWSVSQLVKGEFNIFKSCIYVLYATILLSGYMYTPFMNVSEQLYGFAVYVLILNFAIKKRPVQ